MSLPSDHTQQGRLPADSLRAALAWWEEAGVDVPSVKPARARKPARPAPAQNRDGSSAARSIPKGVPKPQNPATATVAAGSTELIARAAAAAKAAPTLDALKAVIEGFEAADLTANATQAVFARGSVDADIMVIGEAPGREEDQAGQPFVGPAGQLLDKMLASIGLSDNSVYITNLCNWRPINNRTPSPEQIALCQPFINRHIELKAPKHILLVGGAALEALTGQRGLMKLRGNWQTLSIGETDIPAMPLYHPAFLLRRPELKRDAWHDLLTFKAKASGAN